MPLQCPVCEAASVTFCELVPEKIRGALEGYFRRPLPENVAVEASSMQRCSSCELVFANPMKPGDGAFYAWITSQPNYYPKHRWEWDTVKSLIGADSDKHTPAVIDVGCGNGDFLKFLANGINANAIGLDTTPSSVATCLTRGLKVFCSDIGAFCDAHPLEKFDFCVSFHCLEHVDDPLSFIRHIKKLTAADGKIIVSAPYSPMSFEQVWFDPLNHPPHHLTRWNRKSLGALAGRLDMGLTLVTSPAAPLYSRAFRAVQLASGYQNRTLSFSEKLDLAVKNLLPLASSLYGQARRETLEGKTVGDTFLAILEGR